MIKHALKKLKSFRWFFQVIHLKMKWMFSFKKKKDLFSLV